MILTGTEFIDESSGGMNPEFHGTGLGAPGT
jgi:hypothetical protein